MGKLRSGGLGFLHSFVVLAMVAITLVVMGIGSGTYDVAAIVSDGTTTEIATDTLVPPPTDTPVPPTATTTSFPLTATTMSVPPTQTPQPTAQSTATATPTRTATTTPTPTPLPPLSGGSLSLPIRAMFYYGWFPLAWTQGGVYPYTNYHPSLGFYDGSQSSVVAT
ncbi:MAG: hypothetical protein ACJ789_05325, partial [Thermomicrobiales bacterium]